MNEDILVNRIKELLSELQETDSRYARPLFKQIITNNIPVWTAINETPSIAFYISSSEYVDNRFNNTVKAEVVFFIYNRHKKQGISLDDILSPLITKVRGVIPSLKEDENVVSANVISSSKDGGTILPYTIAEVIAKVEFIETNVC